MSDRDLDPHSQHQALRRRAAEATTEPIPRRDREPSVKLSAGGFQWKVPLVTILGACIAAGGGAWQVVSSDRASFRQADADLAARIEVQAEQVRACKAQLATNEVMLSDIRAQLARIDARVAEVQVTLMRGRP